MIRKEFLFSKWWFFSCEKTSIGMFQSFENTNVDSFAYLIIHLDSNDQ
jgi:hypothetical protein